MSLGTTLDLSVFLTIGRGGGQEQFFSKVLSS